MNPTVKDILDYYYGKTMSVSVDELLMHYGMPRRSGRYPWGSGEHPYQRTDDFLARVGELESEGKTEKQVAEALGLTSTQLRAQKALAKDERRALEVATAKSLREHGYSLKAIADKMGFKNDSSVRSLLNEGSEKRMNQAKNTAEHLKKLVEEKGMIDVGAGVERELGVSKEKLNQALYILEREGYPVYGGGMPRPTNPGKQTNLRVLCPQGTEHKEIYNYEKINSAEDYISYDGGETFKKSFEYPSSMDPKRLMINYAEEGGKDKDGVVEIRRGVKDLSLGESNYAQVRILVDGTHYIKGMAVYADDLPEGVDVRFNTNKSVGTPVEKVLKPIKDDPSNPFGSLIKEHGGQSYYDDPDGKFVDEKTGKRQSLSLINKRSEEGDWDEWSKYLSAQFLSKQNKDLIKRQLDLTTADKEDEFSELCSLTNPTVKRVLLEKFASDCDSAAVHLKAAALPRQRYQVILPLTSISDDEVYAPNFKEGEQVALVRFPHGGTFEIPILKVNNKNQEGRRVLGNNALDAIGINSNVAGILSGADFDGDTVLVIPTNSKTKITSQKPFEALKSFDPKMEYGGTLKNEDEDEDLFVNSSTGKTYRRMRNTQTEMGKVSNLITDMTLKGATPEELTKAVRHSMVVIDAEKHGLDYKQSEKDNDIALLKKRYQGRVENGKYREGAATLISRSKAEYDVPKRRGQPWINKETGELEWERRNPKTGEYETKILNETYTDKKGKIKTRMVKSTQMAETKDPHTLSSGTVQEELYANYAAHMKGLANRARKEMLETGRLKYDAKANKTYKEEVNKLNADLNIALMNAPRERQAQAIASSVVAAKKKACPDMTKKEQKKIAQQALVEARLKVGAKHHEVKISDKQWEAIQAGAISDNVLEQILKRADIDDLRQKATPRTTTAISQAKIGKIKAMSSSGYTTSEISEGTGLSESTIIRYLKGKE